MVYIKKWTDFETAATDLYAKSPSKVRYCVRFVPKTGQLVLKLTDDTTCIKYKTFSSIILNRFESLNIRLLNRIANIRPRARPALPESTPAGGAVGGVDEEEAMNGMPGRGGTPARGGTPVPTAKGGAAAGPGGTTGGGVSGAGGSAGGGGKKKKQGKR